MSELPPATASTHRWTELSPPVLFVVAMAIALGVIIGLAEPEGRTWLLIPWVALCGPAFSVTMILWTFVGGNPGMHWQIMTSVGVGLVYGLYAVLAFLPQRKALLAVALFVHMACAFLAFVLMMMNC